MTDDRAFSQPTVAVVVGTRPELVKMAPVVRQLERDDQLDLLVIHTNQHYDSALSASFFEALDLPSPDLNLDVGSGSQAKQTAAGLVGVETAIEEHAVDVVLAQGDTNAVMATALAASKLPIPFGHVEAGLRSFDWTMPEEVNRVVADRVADLLFAPTEDAETNLAAEGIEDGVFVTGNTVVDACLEHVPLAERRSTVLDRIDADAGEYVAATIHRPRNTDDPDRLARIVRAFGEVEFPVVFPAHPRTRTALDEWGIEIPDGLTLLEPLGYFDFLTLQRNARLVVTDSGGVQEEASILEVPCLTVRPNTERPETVTAGVNELVEPPELAGRIAAIFSDDQQHRAMTGSPDLYGDGDAGERIVSVVRSLLDGGDDVSDEGPSGDR